MEWLLWPVSLAVMSRIGRYLLYGVAALARVGGRCPGGHACLSAVMPASAACQDPWRCANTAHTFFCRRTQGAGANWVSRCGAGASPSVLLPEAPGLRGGCWRFNGAQGHGVPDQQVSGGQAEAEGTSLSRGTANPARHQAAGNVRECPVLAVSGCAANACLAGGHACLAAPAPCAHTGRTAKRSCEGG